MASSANIDETIHNPNEYLKIPDWITADYFKQVLQKDEPEYEEIKEFMRVAAIPPGENFMSIMVRIHMKLLMKDGSVKTKRYILKTMLDVDSDGALGCESEAFDKEVLMYERYIPAFESLYRDVGREVRLAPRCLLVEKCTNGRINIVFEDLSDQNYDNVNRLNGFTMSEMRAVLHKLAEFHAASVVYRERHGPYDKKLSGMPNEKMYSFLKNLYDADIETYREVLPQWGLEDGGEKYVKKLPTFDQLWQSYVRSHHPHPEELQVLLHGDLWSGNVMLKHNEARRVVEGALLIDFQDCHWGSAIQDLLLLITISASKDIRIKEFDHFIEIYHGHLCECLRLLKYEKRLPKLRNLHMDLYRETNSFHAFFPIFSHLIVVLLPTDKNCNNDMLFGITEEAKQCRKALLLKPRFVEAIRDIYPFYQRRGMFNFIDYDDTETAL